MFSCDYAPTQEIMFARPSVRTSEKKIKVFERGVASSNTIKMDTTSDKDHDRYALPW